MQTASRTFLVVAGLSLVSANMLSAYGFHGLPGKVPEPKLASWEWANRMQFYHSLALILIALLLERSPRSWLLRIAGGLMIAGMVLFSAGIYADVLGAPPAVAQVAPLGGSAFMLGWFLTAIAGLRSADAPASRSSA